MPPQLALLLTVGVVVFLFRRESRNGDGISRALWIPLLWMLITGSRFVGQWLGVLTGGGSGGVGYEEGSSLDALVFLALIAAGFSVLRLRQVTVSEVIRSNVWISIFFIYCFVAILWSDFPFVAFKRWIKVLGHPIMALVILTEPNPIAALRGVLKRTAFVLLPFSIMLIKYFPHIGRGFDPWNGQAVNNGVNLTKNELGCIGMIAGLFFVWNLLQAIRLENRKACRSESILSVSFLAMSVWLLSIAQSATSLACMMMGVGAMLLLGRRWVDEKYLGIYVVIGVLAFGAAESLLGVYANVVQMLGRNPNLTDRTEVWTDALALVDNAVLGTGFESFWLGERLDKLWAKWWWQPNQSHNGYIETYLNLGVVGVILLIAMVVAAFKKSQAALLRDFEFGRLRMALMVVVLAYNFTEATFKGVAIMWTLFHIIALDCPRYALNPASQAFDPAPGIQKTDM